MEAEPEPTLEEIKNSNTPNAPALLEKTTASDEDEIGNNMPSTSEEATTAEDADEELSRDTRGFRSVGYGGVTRGLGLGYGVGYDAGLNGLGYTTGLRGVGYGTGLGYGYGTGFGLGNGVGFGRLNGISLGTGAIRVPAHGGAVGRTTLLRSFRTRTDPIVRHRVDYVPRRVTVTGQRHVTVPYFRRVTTRVTNLGPGNAHVRKVETGERHAPVAGGSRSFYRHLGSRIAPTIAVKGAVAAPAYGVGYVGGVRRVNTGVVGGKVW